MLGEEINIVRSITHKDKLSKFYRCQRQSKSEPKGSVKCCHFWVWDTGA